MKLRNRSPVLRDSLYVTHSLAHLNIKSGQFLVRSVEKSEYDNIKHGILSWFSKTVHLIMQINGWQKKPSLFQAEIRVL